MKIAVFVEFVYSLMIVMTKKTTNIHTKSLQAPHRLDKCNKVDSSAIDNIAYFFAKCFFATG